MVVRHLLNRLLGQLHHCVMTTRQKYDEAIGFAPPVPPQLATTTVAGLDVTGACTRRPGRGRHRTCHREGRRGSRPAVMVRGSVTTGTDMPG
ncbi:hypothetical protein SAVERM_782 [Streptomyces avermitilis MA-4680 = NBRC 14893]|uniref:Uncharacterized protein n=1 Tax=Streptomyces avermitilis (strain ATCC 31267 / DSM 46492 / JCM 5070 / NBRC 14893 / NCIMB 12804 / NRRL 8165 / MA-4680) TaxID=227882 RepID=Q82PU0_STRAW|nr:hypothetical protein SAVERM_782 [Streptomyces avermitilis MA-4680 = NBRC 14893]